PGAPPRPYTKLFRSILVPPRSMPRARADAPSGAGAIATTLPTLGLEAGQLPLQPVDGLHRRRIHPVEVRQVEADIIPQIQQGEEPCQRRVALDRKST